MSAIAAARRQINDVADEAGLAIDVTNVELADKGLAEAVTLPDGKRIFPTKIGGVAIHKIAAALLDMQDPAASRFLKLTGPPGTGKSQTARMIALHIWTEVLGREVETRDGVPFYGFYEMSGGPSSDEFTFKYEFVPDQDRPGDVRLVPSAFVRAMQEGSIVMIDEPNTIRDVALLSLNATLDGRLTLYLPAEGRTVIAQPGFAVLLAYNPGLVGATDIPDAWYSRFPASVEVTSNWAALVQLGAPERLVKAAAALDAKRHDPKAGIVWTPQFRDLEALWQMMQRTDERTGIALFISNLYEQMQAGRVQGGEAQMACRMLDEAGYTEIKVREAGKIPNLHGYPRAVAV